MHYMHSCILAFFFLFSFSFFFCFLFLWPLSPLHSLKKKEAKASKFQIRTRVCYTRIEDSVTHALDACKYEKLVLKWLLPYDQTVIPFILFWIIKYFSRAFPISNLINENQTLLTLNITIVVVNVCSLLTCLSCLGLLL